MIGLYEGNATSKSLWSHCLLLPDQPDRYICGKHGKSASINATSLRIKDQTLLERSLKKPKTLKIEKKVKFIVAFTM